MVARLLAPDGLHGLVVEILKERERLRCAAGFGGDNVERRRRVELLGVALNGGGVGAVQHVQIKVAVVRAKDFGKGFRGQAGAAHAEQQRVGVARLAHIVHQLVDAAELLVHALGNIQPAQPVADLVGIGLPHRVVAIPDALHDLVVRQLLHALIHGGQQTFEFSGHVQHVSSSQDF